MMGCVRDLIEDACNELPGSFRRLVERLPDHLKELDRQVNELEAQIKDSHRKSEASRKQEKVPGIGPITVSALVAIIGGANNFENGRQLAAWMGLVPTQSSSGGKTNLLGISRRGDTYLRNSASPRGTILEMSIAAAYAPLNGVKIRSDKTAPPLR